MYPLWVDLRCWDKGYSIDFKGDGLIVGMAVEVDFQVIGTDIEMGEAGINWLVEHLADFRLIKIDMTKIERSSMRCIELMQRERLENEEDDLIG